MLLTLAQCSPYKYGEEIKSFDKVVIAYGEAIDAARTAFDTDEALRIAALHRTAIGRGTTRLVLSDACKLPTSPFAAVPPNARCHVEIVSGTARAPAVSGIEAVLDREEKIATRLEAYTKALKAITDAEDRKALDTATKDICSAASALDGAANPAAGPIAAAACGLVGLGVGAAFDTARWQVLRSSVVLVDDRVTPAVAEVIGRDLDVIGRAGIDTRRQMTVDDDGRLADAEAGRTGSRLEYEALVGRMLANAATIDATLRSRQRKAIVDKAQSAELAPVPAPLAQNPDSPITRNKVALGLWQAHRALREAIERNDGQMEAVLVALGDFADGVKDLRKAVAKPTE